MAFLKVGGTTVTVAGGSLRRTVQEIGDNARAWDGSYRETIRSRVSMWQGETTPLTLADASSVYSTFTSSSQPQSIGGTMVSASSTTFSGYTHVTDWRYSLASTALMVLSFSIDQSS